MLVGKYKEKQYQRVKKRGTYYEKNGYSPGEVEIMRYKNGSMMNKFVEKDRQ